MQIVIDIDKYKYKAIKNLYSTFSVEMKEWGLEAISNGTPLPKGHGKLVDADKIGLSDIEIAMCDGSFKEALLMLINKIEDAPPIIEADKEDINE